MKEGQHGIDLRKQGKVATAYADIEKPEGFVIFNAESREALDELLMTLPMYEHANFQITLLITAEQALKHAKQGKNYGPTPT